MKRVALFLTLATGLTASGGALANFENGTDLYEQCTTKESEEVYYQQNASCLAYIAGVADTMSCKQAVFGYTWSPDGNVTKGQLAKVVLKWLDDNPKYLSYNAASLVASALDEAFPCPK